MTGARSLVTPLCVCEFMIALLFHLCTKKKLIIIITIIIVTLKQKTFFDWIHKNNLKKSK
jgi:hypothetical protein